MRNAWPEFEAYTIAGDTSLEPVGHLKFVRCEQSFQKPYIGYDILWFVWNRDGPLHREDWEPLVFFWRGDSLIQVTTRPHYEFNEYFAEGYGAPVFTYPLKIVFVTTWHAAVLETKGTEQNFQKAVAGSSRITTTINAIKGENVPQGARRPPIRRRGLFVWFGEDIHDYAIQTLETLEKVLKP